MTPTDIFRIIDYGATIFLLSFIISVGWGLGQDLISRMLKKVKKKV